MLVAGVIGAVVLSAISDTQRKRVRFLVLALVLAIPGLLGVTFATSAWLLYPSAAVLGFFVVAALPIGMQYAAEVTYPTPEGTSNGLVQLCGQVSVVFVYVMSALKTANGSFTVSLLLAAGLLAVGAIGVSRLRDPVVGALAESQARRRRAPRPSQRRRRRAWRRRSRRSVRRREPGGAGTAGALGDLTKAPRTFASRASRPRLDFRRHHRRAGNPPAGKPFRVTTAGRHWEYEASRRASLAQ